MRVKENTNINVSSKSPDEGDAGVIQNDNVGTSIAVVHDECPAASPGNPDAPAGSPAAQLQYTRVQSVEAAHSHAENIIAVCRDEYVLQFKKAVEKSARATLDMCRIVYEASRVLQEADFDAFCKAIGYKDSSSTIRKFIAIGKVQPRMIQYADQLPHSWSNIYQLTQIPAKEFEAMLKNGISLTSLKGSALTELVKSTKEINSIESYLPLNQQIKKVVFGHLYFTKAPIDDTDWRAMAKAINELESRLPIKFVINNNAEYVWEQRKNQRYEMTKKSYESIELKPELWDLGRDANATDNAAIQAAAAKAALAEAKAEAASNSKSKELDVA